MAPSSGSESPSTPSKAGITVTADGQRVIPSSLRPDGSARKEIRVRPGYRPPEDVEIYKSRNAEAWKNRGSGGVPGADTAADATASAATTNEKNAKRKAARKRAKEASDAAPPPEEEPPKPAEPPARLRTSEATDEEKEKMAKAIRKKIRQANELKGRKEGGEALLPEQLEKVIKVHELIRQLNSLGFEQ